MPFVAYLGCQSTLIYLLHFPYRQDPIPMLSYRTVEPRTWKLLKKLSDKDFLSEARLVGGTALALQYGHRMSVDLDFFGNINGNDIDLKGELREVGTLSVIKESKNINVFLLDGIKVDFINHSYPWIDDAVKEQAIVLASPQDIAALKINAIEGRGSKKDFIDLYFLLKHYSLQELLNFYTRKYPEYSLFRALMSLTYFEDAEKQLMPKMFVDIEWEEMKEYIRKEVAHFSL